MSIASSLSNESMVSFKTYGLGIISGFGPYARLRPDAGATGRRTRDQ